MGTLPCTEDPLQTCKGGWKAVPASISTLPYPHGACQALSTARTVQPPPVQGLGLGLGTGQLGQGSGEGEGCGWGVGWSQNSSPQGDSSL